jgi:hypothetical protein
LAAPQPAYDGRQETAPAPPGPPAPERKIIRSGEVTLFVDSADAARRELETRVRAAGGYVASAQADHAPGSAASSTLVVRVPAAALDNLVHQLASLGDIVRESLAAEEVTDQYYDSHARLVNARRLEVRLLEIVARRTDKVADVLEVERELGRVRGEIEQLEGRLRLWDHQVALSALTVHLSARDREVALAPASLGGQARATLRSSVETLGELVRGVALCAVALVPWAPVLFLVGYGAARVLRRRRRLVAASAPVTSA